MSPHFFANCGQRPATLIHTEIAPLALINLKTHRATLGWRRSEIRRFDKGAFKGLLPGEAMNEKWVLCVGDNSVGLASLASRSFLQNISLCARFKSYRALCFASKSIFVPGKKDPERLKLALRLLPALKLIQASFDKTSRLSHSASRGSCKSPSPLLQHQLSRT